MSTEQPFIKLSQEEYGEHHSSIMHCRFALCSATFKKGELRVNHLLTHSSLFFRVDGSGRRVASLDVDGVIKVIYFDFNSYRLDISKTAPCCSCYQTEWTKEIKAGLFFSSQVWSFNPIMQTKATIMSKSPLLSLEWATKPDRLVKVLNIYYYYYYIGIM